MQRNPNLILTRSKVIALDMRWCILRSLIRARGTQRGSLAESNGASLRCSQLWRTRRFSSDSGKKHDDGKTEDRKLAAAISAKYRILDEANVDVILDVAEEQEKIKLEELNARKTSYDPYADIDLNRGTDGVFDIEDLVALLAKDKAKNIFVASVPKEYTYVDYIVVVTGKSPKHMSMLATFVRKVYKLKRHSSDILPRIEGKDSNQWIALDLGNIALHIFSDSARQRYDLETLWTVGSQYDDRTNILEEPDIMDQYNSFLAELQPADSQ